MAERVWQTLKVKPVDDSVFATDGLAGYTQGGGEAEGTDKLNEANKNKVKHRKVDSGAVYKAHKELEVAMEHGEVVVGGTK